jgi:hypothetical protein
MHLTLSFWPMLLQLRYQLAQFICNAEKNIMLFNVPAGWLTTDEYDVKMGHIKSLYRTHKSNAFRIILILYSEEQAL